MKLNRLIVFALCGTAIVANAAQQCFSRPGIYGAVTITESAGCAQNNPFVIAGRTGFAMTAASSCTISFSKPIVTSSVSIDIDGNGNGDVTTISTNAGAYTVIPADITAPLVPAMSPGSIAAGAGVIDGIGSGTFRFTSSPPATISALTIALVPGAGGTFYRVCADDSGAPPTSGRPDPSQDPEVIGLLNAQTSTAKRFALTQSSNFMQHLESLHSRRPHGDNSASLLSQQPVRSVSQNVLGGTATGDGQSTVKTLLSLANESQSDNLTQSNAGVFGIPDSQQTSSASSLSLSSFSLNGNASDFMGSGIQVWSAGVVSLGRLSGIDASFTTSGVSLGADTTFGNDLILGIGVGVGRDRQDIGNNDTRTTGSNYSITTYGSYRPSESVFIDGLVGYGRLDFDSERYASGSGQMASSDRTGSQWFASLSSGYEYVRDDVLLSPYARVDIIDTHLDDATEHGAGIYNLNYSDQTIATRKLSLGVRGEMQIEFATVTAKPYFRLEYQHDFEKPGAAKIRYADQMSGPTYLLQLDGLDHNVTVLGLGSSFVYRKDWFFNVYSQFSKGSGSTTTRTFGLGIKKTF